MDKRRGVGSGSAVCGELRDGRNRQTASRAGMHIPVASAKLPHYARFLWGVFKLRSMRTVSGREQ